MHFSGIYEDFLASPQNTCKYAAAVMADGAKK
jgi:hypothetical protein